MRYFLLIATLMAFSSARVNYVSAGSAHRHVGSVATVQGTLFGVYQSRKGNVFLNLDGSYPNQKFSAVIFNDYTYLFDINRLRSKVGSQILIRGRIKTYRGKPEIIIREKNQILNY